MVYQLPKDIDEFAEAVRKTINQKFLYPEKADGWGLDFDGRILIHVRPEDKLDDHLYLKVNLEDGECKSIDTNWGEEPSDYGFAYRGDYSDWKSLLKSNSLEMLSDGTFDFEGDLKTWLSYKDTNYMRIEAAQELPTEFEEE